MKLLEKWLSVLRRSFSPNLYYYDEKNNNDIDMNSANRTDTINNASTSLAQDLILHSTDNLSLSPKVYLTTLGLIVLTHLLFLYQWLKMKTRREVAATYDQIIQNKQYHKLIEAVLSHPPSEGRLIPTSTIRHQQHSNRSRNAFEIEYGDEYRDDSTQNGSRLQLLGRFIFLKFKEEIINPLTKGHLSGLPLLTYISHIMWQCRALEEIYDYRIDSQNPHVYNTEFNISTIIERDTMIQNSIRNKEVSKSLKRMSQYSFEYYRVIFSLIVTSYMLDFLVTHLILRFAQRQRDRLPGRMKTLLESQAKRGICTLTPVCIALLVIYSSHFPHTPISVIPFIDTGFVFRYSSDLTFVMAYFILTILSQKSYPITGMLYGSLTGLFWTNGVIQFLADRYWGGFYIFICCFLCSASLKTEFGREGRRRLNDFFLWLDYVSWNF